MDSNVVSLESKFMPKWIAPQQSWVKINVDGAVCLRDSFAACGGMIRDASGQWLIGFSRSLGSCPVIFAELWGVHDALKHASSMGCRRIIIETDSADVASMFSRDNEALRGNTFASEVCRMINLDCDVRFCKISRDQNRIVDVLARSSRGRPVGETIYTAVPPFVYDLIKERF